MKYNFEKTVEVGYVDREDLLKFVLKLKENKEFLLDMFKSIPKLNWDFLNFIKVETTKDCAKKCFCCEDDQYDGGYLEVDFVSKSTDKNDKFVMVKVKLLYKSYGWNYDDKVSFEQLLKIDFTNGCILELGKVWDSQGFTEEEMQREKFEELVKEVLLDVTQIQNWF